MFIDDFEKSLRFEKFGKVWKLVWKVWKSLEIGLESLEKYSFLDDFQTFQTNFQTFPNFSQLFPTFPNLQKSSEKNIFNLSHMMNVVIFHHLSPIN